MDSISTVGSESVQTFQPITPSDRRSPKRPLNEWRLNESEKEMHIRDFRGHYLVVVQCNVGGWCKYIDGHFRGHVEILEMAKMQLEREAYGESLAWGIK